MNTPVNPVDVSLRSEQPTPLSWGQVDGNWSALANAINLLIVDVTELQTPTMTGADFVQPAINGSVNARFNSTSRLTPGVPIFVLGGGFYMVQLVTTPTTASIINLGYPGNAIQGATISSPALTVTAGLQGPAGADGAQGPAGDTGQAGSPGINSFTTLTADFQQPAVSGTVSASMVETAWLAPQQVIFVQTGGYYQVQSVDTATTATLINLGYPGSANPGEFAINGSSVVAGGLQGTGGGGGVSSFIELSDCPHSYADQENKVVRVTAAADGLHFVDPLPSWDMSATGAPMGLIAGPFPPTSISGDSFTVTKPAGGIGTAKGTVALPASGKYWVAAVPVSTSAPGGSVQAVIAATSSALTTSSGFGFGSLLGAGLFEFINSAPGSLVDAAYVAGTAFVLQFDMDTDTLSVKTTNGTFPAGLSVAAMEDLYGLIQFGGAGPNTATLRLSTTTGDTGGVTPDAGYNPLQQVGLPPGSSKGDILQVLVAATFNGFTPSVNDIAIVREDGASVNWVLASTTLPIAGSNLGAVKNGGNITVDGSGQMNAPTATDSALGLVKGGTNISIGGDGSIDASIPVATDAILGGVIPNAQDFTVDGLGNMDLSNAVKQGFTTTIYGALSPTDTIALSYGTKTAYLDNSGHTDIAGLTINGFGLAIGTTEYPYDLVFHAAINITGISWSGWTFQNTPPASMTAGQNYTFRFLGGSIQAWLFMS